MLENLLERGELLRCEVDTALVPEGTFDFSKAPDYGSRSTVIVATWLPPQVVKSRGLPPGSICGVVTSPDLSVTETGFIPNRAFIDLLHRLNVVRLDPDLLEFVSSTDEPAVAVIDERSADVAAAIPPEDIIGHYSIANRSVGNYHLNPNFRLVSDRGVCRLTPWLRRCLIETVIRGQHVP